MNRRQFTITAACGIAGLATSCGRRNEVIDIHQHLSYSGRTDEDFLKHQETMGITRSVLLPAASQLTMFSTHLGKSNGLAAGVSVTAAAATYAEKHPGKFVYFCNEVPDKEDAVSTMEGWLKKGAVGIGELKFNMPCDSDPMIRIFELANEYAVPVLIHFQHEMYNLGFERFHKILERFPKVNFIGHAQTWWGNIDANHDQSVMYPEGKVTPGGLTDRYLSDYPNMYADLSAGSGKNALTRDPEHAAAFIERHQDKLCLGTDCSDTVGIGEKCSGSQQITNLKQFAPSSKIQAKLFYKNARRIINFG
tara:strand:+ start:551 stop:1471 length:921 start_codon:yes stop_codon:yes gene_type:complete